MRKLFGFYLLLFKSSPALASLQTVAVKALNPQEVNHTYLFLICVNALFFIGIFIAMAVYIINNRKAGLDLIWSMLPAIMVIVMVGLGWINFHGNHLGETFYAVKFSP